MKKVWKSKNFYFLLNHKIQLNKCVKSLQAVNFFLFVKRRQNTSFFVTENDLFWLATCICLRERSRDLARLTPYWKFLGRKAEEICRKMKKHLKLGINKRCPCIIWWWMDNQNHKDHLSSEYFICTVSFPADKRFQSWRRKSSHVKTYPPRCAWNRIPPLIPGLVSNSM